MVSRDAWSGEMFQRSFIWGRAAVALNHVENTRTRPAASSTRCFHALGGSLTLYAGKVWWQNAGAYHTQWLNSKWGIFGYGVAHINSHTCICSLGSSSAIEALRASIEATQQVRRGNSQRSLLFEQPPETLSTHFAAVMSRTASNCRDDYLHKVLLRLLCGNMVPSAFKPLGAHAQKMAHGAIYSIVRTHGTNERIQLVKTFTAQHLFYTIDNLVSTAIISGVPRSTWAFENFRLYWLLSD